MEAVGPEELCAGIGVVQGLSVRTVWPFSVQRYIGDAAKTHFAPTIDRTTHIQLTLNIPNPRAAIGRPF
jgi:hypothetical protein